MAKELDLTHGRKPAWFGGIPWILLLLLGAAVCPASEFLGEDLSSPLFGFDRGGDPDDLPWFKLNGKDRMGPDRLPRYWFKLTSGVWIASQSGEFRRFPITIAPVPIVLPDGVNFSGIEKIAQEERGLPYFRIAFRPFGPAAIHEVQIEYFDSVFDDQPQIGRGPLAAVVVSAWYRLRLIRSRRFEFSLEAGWSLFNATSELLTGIDLFGRPEIEKATRQVHNPIYGFAFRIPFTVTFHMLLEARGNAIDLDTRTVRTTAGFEWQMTQALGWKATYEWYWIELLANEGTFEEIYNKTIVHGGMLALTLSI